VSAVREERKQQMLDRNHQQTSCTVLNVTFNTNSLLWLAYELEVELEVEVYCSVEA